MTKLIKPAYHDALCPPSPLVSAERFFIEIFSKRFSETLSATERVLKMYEIHM